ncbi:hypothetical protein [Enterococcus larvae]|uniref:hypothetical protein n=1 Tax=Enterococcus larvae TaxID=2794352 RepID=UPI003F33D0A8
MKLGRKMVIGGVLLGFGLVGFSGKAEAYYGNVQVPSYTLTNYLNEELSIGFVPEEGQDLELDQSYGGVPRYLFEKEFLSFEPRIMGYESSSLEGLQNVDTKKLVLHGQPYDFNPIANIWRLEELEIYLVGGHGYGGRAKTGSQDLSFMRQGFVNLKTFKYEQGDSADATNALLDVSELSDHPSLEQVDIKTAGGMQSISMRSGYRKYEVFNPIVLSSQFEGAEIVYSSTDATFTNTDGLLKWNAVPQDTEYLNLSWTVTQGAFHYEGDVQIPIDWK